MEGGCRRTPMRQRSPSGRLQEADQLIRWGRSLFDLIGSLQELSTLGVSFVSLCEALDLTTPSGRALAGMLAVFAEFEREILRERVKAGIAQARARGQPHGRTTDRQSKQCRN